MAVEKVSQGPNSGHVVRRQVEERDRSGLSRDTGGPLTRGTDRIDLSHWAKYFRKIRSLLDLGRFEPDRTLHAREEKVDRVKTRLKTDFYSSKDVRLAVAEGVLQLLIPD
ncbi:MAG TPA: hypothetical protein EYP53_09265 [Candidatus Latescibacteria bacterium]|nr:hypothetical protein [Candidatus Latescibacterota bacterium]